MKKNKKMIISIIIIVVIILLLWFFLNNKKEIVFNIKNKNIEIKIGENAKIDYELNEKIVINWKSDNEKIVTVNNGIITGIGLGNTIVHGSITKENERITRDIYVSTYSGEKNIALNEIIVPSGELFITRGSSYKIDYSYNPTNSYITSIEYSSMDENIVSFTDGNIIANNIGNTSIIITVNKNISKTIPVNVIEKSTVPTFSKKVEDVILEKGEITIKPGETSEIKYSVTPEDGYIENVKWTSSDESIVTVADGQVVGKSSGETIVSMIVNNEIVKEVKVIVTIPVSGINLKSRGKIVLKIGGTETITTNITPANATNKEINYSSSSNSVTINQNGVVTGVKEGSGTITVKTIDGNYKVDIPFVVNKRTGVINGDGGLWGYSQTSDKVPNRMDLEFFSKLVSQGKGTLSGNTYTYTDNKRSYTYDITNSLLKTEGRNAMVRMYYPPGVDLSEVSIFAFFGGSGEREWGSYFSHLENNREEMKSSGITILISVKSGHSYYENDGIYATEFVQSITNQKAGIKNAVGGYSAGGDASGKAANTGKYSRLILYDTGFNANNTTNVKDIEILFYKPSGPTMLEQALNTLNVMFRDDYTNVTVITNNSGIASNNNYLSKFLIINPGDSQGHGHGYGNITKAKVFSYACS